jgi:hypothetical protein
MLPYSAASGQNNNLKSANFHQTQKITNAHVLPEWWSSTIHYEKKFNPSLSIINEERRKVYWHHSGQKKCVVLRIDCLPYLWKYMQNIIALRETNTHVEKQFLSDLYVIWRSDMFRSGLCSLLI